ncbi:MAG: class I SAM-dependent RNA methyltransferase [Clostridiales bacterium]|nr:class I SAM-dependent RNA methyltransferase [Clostridiales bacterium]
MSTYEFSVPTLFGLEGIAGDELRRLDIENVRVENGRVLFSGDERALAKANVCLRTGERVLLVLADFQATTFEQLFQGVYHANLEDFIPKDGAFPVKGHCLSSQLMSVPDCQAIVKKAASRRLGEKYGVSWLPETGAKYQLQFSIMNDRVQLFLDTSGPGLHKRGYRAVGNDAPLRETLAAAMVTLTRYRGRDFVWDPFCGSGTIPIEAALIAKNRAPGLDRSFAAQKWKNMDSKLWLDAADEAMDKEFHGAYDIWGGDIDPAAIELAKHNAELAGVEDCIRFEVADAGKFHRDSEYGQLVTNPPYGERLLEKKEAEELYRVFGAAMRTMPPKWRILVLSSHTEFERCFGRPADKKRKLYNGMLKCDVFQYGK